MEDCPMERFQDWMKNQFMLEDFSEFCGFGIANVPDTVELKQNLAFYSFMKRIMSYACIAMLFIIGATWYCMGKQSEYQRSDFARELSNFGSNIKLKTSDGSEKPAPSNSNYEDRLKSHPTEPAELEPQPLDHAPDFALETNNSYEEGGSFRFDQDDLKLEKKKKRSAIAVTDTDRAGINDSVNQDSYVQHRVGGTPDRNEERTEARLQKSEEEAESVEYVDEEDGIGEEI